MPKIPHHMNRDRITRIGTFPCSNTSACFISICYHFVALKKVAERHFGSDRMIAKENAIRRFGYSSATKM